MEEYDFLFKIIVLGDGGCGKTALTVRFSQGYFQESYKMTVGVDFSVKLLEAGGKKAKLQIWDTGGQERFSFVRPLYYRGAMGALLVFDVTNRESFDHLPNWVEELESNAGKVPFVLVGNKIDLDRAVSSDEAWDFCKQFNIPYYYETSAKTGEAVGDCFHGLTYAMMDLTMDPADYPNVMKQLGAIAGIGATPVTAAAPRLSVPQVQSAPAASSDFSGANEYSDFEGNAEELPAQRPAPVVKRAPAPVVQPLPKPAAKQAFGGMAMQPLPKSSAPAEKPASKAKPAPTVQPLPKPTPISISGQRPQLAKPQVKPLPVAKPLPKPVAARPQVPPVPDQKPSAKSMGLFDAAETIEEEPPVEVPELPVPKTAAASRNVKLAAVTRPSAEEALPEIVEVVEKPAAKKQARPAGKAEKAAAASPVIFQKATPAATEQAVKGKAGSKAAAAAASKAPQAAASTSAGSSSSSFLAALSARSLASSEAVTSGGRIPFSAGFTATKQVGGGASKSSGMSVFFQSSIPDDLLHMKKQKKKAAPKGGAAAATSDVIKCPGCGYSVSAKMRFCNKCGTKLK